ncbi:hypothetical protein [Spiroplasma endosymbiont of Lonchoptera lutea]|uniref:hypothetical protein n=1 Tax=Spiroplasma endosymbiont of Lonchoptera lutea TaxID=3066297 RepID=UPI0030CE3B14
MKKLLSLLSVLTVSGTAMPTVIATSPYQKQEKINQLKNSEFNLQKNNLEKLKRNKRENNTINKIDSLYLRNIEKFYSIPSYNINKGYFLKNNKNNIYFLNDTKIYKLKDDNSSIEIKIEELNENNKIKLFEINDNYLFITTEKIIYKININDNQITKIYTFDISESLYSMTIDSNDNVYFGTNNALYKLNTNNNLLKIKENFKKVTKIVSNNSSEIIFFIEQEGNVTELFELKNNLSKKINFDINIIGQINNNSFKFDKYENLYFLTAISPSYSTNAAYKLEKNSNIAKQITGINEELSSLTIDSYNNIYFGTNNGIFKLNYGLQNATKIEHNEFVGKVYLIISDFLDNVYFYTDYGLYKLNSNNLILKITGILDEIKIDNLGIIRNIHIDKNGNVYLITKFKEFYFLNHGSDKIIKVANFNNINIDLENIIVDKYNNVYFSTKHNDIFKIFLGTDNQEDEIDFTKWIKLGIFYTYKREKPNFQIANIKDISIESFFNSSLNLTTNTQFLSLIKNTCSEIETKFKNDSELEQKENTPPCETTLETIDSFQITKGLSKKDGTSTTDGTINTTGREHFWEIGGEIEKSFKTGPLAEVKAKISSKTGGKYNSSEQTNHSVTKTIENVNTIADQKKYDKKETIKISIPSSSIQIPAKSEVILKHSADLYKIKTIWNIKQEITGNIKATVVDDFNNSNEVYYSIKNIMNELKNNGLLFDIFEISENNNSIIFNGKLITTSYKINYIVNIQ